MLFKPCTKYLLKKEIIKPLFQINTTEKGKKISLQTALLFLSIIWNFWLKN